MRRRGIQWDFDAWEDYLYWQQNDKKIVKRINQIIKDIVRSPFDGIGKPEPLKEKSGGILESPYRR
ncbi:addiction module toxin, Txe/YoeB family [Selenomonas sp. oral taxon 138 str. F0429]|nr:addiction module toxin, Txe/YoeB family [Selenomonas sp. oral taxon 138 str. F0429]